MNNLQIEKIISFLTELVEFRKREVNDMLKVGYARLSIPKYQERTAELLAILSSFKTSSDDKLILTDAIDNSYTGQNKILLNEDKQNDELQSIKEKYLYLIADFDNYKKRVVRNEKLVHDKVYEDVILHFLRIYDDLERSVIELDKSQTPEQKMFEIYESNPLHVGIRLAFENFEKTLHSLNCEKIECHIGDKFDVNIMEAISTKETNSKEQDVVVDIYQSGWKMNENVIRPVKVIVGK